VNRDTAMLRLRQKLFNVQQAKLDEAVSKVGDGSNSDPSFSSISIRSYILFPYELVKDSR
jgi:hypothetical protein